uniref:Uncharacterized protein n=1 Tax=Coralloluteibacterium stylophorae TaxID=1776034 RepID=A0A8J8AZ55_9GAMM
MDRSSLDDFVASAALLAGHLTRQCEKAVSDQASAAAELRQVAEGAMSLADLAGKAGEPQQHSGRQEAYENLLNQYLLR